jgi:anti-sigma factor RsiW
MCPDRQLLSVYLDGELPSPWKEKMETHLGRCPQCGERLETYRRLFAPLSAPPENVAKERVWRALEAGVRSGIYGGPRRYAAVWRRSVSIPLPAAAAVAVVIIAALAALWVRRPAENTALPNMIVASEENLAPGVVPVSDMNGVLQYLGAGDSGDILILRLPESRSFTSSGEPAIIRAADYARNAAVRTSRTSSESSGPASRRQP